MSESVIISVPARLNISAYNMDAIVLNKLGGGGIGLAIKLYTTISIAVNNEQQHNISGNHSKIAKVYIDYLTEKFNISKKLNVHIEQPLKPHTGLATSSAVAVGIIYCFNKLFSLNLSYKDIIFLHSSKIMEEHNNLLNESVLTGVSSWAMCLGGMVIVDDDGSLINQYKIKECNDYSVLIVTPKKIMRNTLEDEIHLLKGNGTAFDLRDKNEKKTLFLKIEECFDNNNQKAGLKFMNKLLSTGSKIAELEYQNHKYNGLISELLLFGKENKILTMGMSAIGPSVFFIDSNDVINELLNNLVDNFEHIDVTKTAIHNDGVSAKKGH